jgi:hypothetical protein
VLNRPSMLVPVAGTSEYLAVTTGDQDITTAMAAGELWLFTANVDCYIKQGAAAPITASAADGSMLVPAGMPVLIDANEGAVLSVLGTAAGLATLQKMKICA